MPDETSSPRSTDSAPAPRPASTGADISASIQAARELGPEYDEAIAAAIVERLNPVIDERVRQRIDESGGGPAAAAADKQAPDNHGWTPRMTMGLLAMCFVIPLSAIGASALGPGGVIMAWVGIIVLYLISVAGGRR